eukprot:scaffold66586_cov36-Phaeocystis_antarctica.AAC.1
MRPCHRCWKRSFLAEGRSSLYMGFERQKIAEARKLVDENKVKVCKKGEAGKSVGRGPHFRTLAAEKSVGRPGFYLGD